MQITPERMIRVVVKFRNVIVEVYYVFDYGKLKIISVQRKIIKR